MPPEIIAEKKEPKWSRIAKLLIKLSITVFCFWYISGKINFSQAFEALQTANWAFLFLALVAYLLSKVAAAARLNIYFRDIRLHLPLFNNVKLYWLGMFYNLFLPGSISGDAYKVVLLHKRYQTAYKSLSAAVLLDRFSGLLGLGVMLCVFGMMVVENKLVAAALPVGLIMAIAGSYLAVKKFSPVFLPGFWPTFSWGMVVQFFANISAVFVIISLGIDSHLHQYLFIFLVASVAAVLPLTIGGLGAREVVFFHLSEHFGLDVHRSILIGLLFYLLNVATSAQGLFFIFNDPLKPTKKENESQSA